MEDHHDLQDTMPHHGRDHHCLVSDNHDRQDNENSDKFLLQQAKLAFSKIRRYDFKFEDFEWDPNPSKWLIEQFLKWISMETH